MEVVIEAAEGHHQGQGRGRPGTAGGASPGKGTDPGTGPGIGLGPGTDPRIGIKLLLILSFIVKYILSL